MDGYYVLNQPSPRGTVAIQASLTEFIKIQSVVANKAYKTDIKIYQTNLAGRGYLFIEKGAIGTLKPDKRWDLNFKVIGCKMRYDHPFTSPSDAERVFLAVDKEIEEIAHSFSGNHMVTNCWAFDWTFLLFDGFMTFKEIDVETYRKYTRWINLTLETSVMEHDTLKESKRELYEHITLCDGTDEIRTGAFSKCKNLKSITLPSSVKIIESHAFFQCSSLKTVHYEGTKEQREAMEIGTNKELMNAEWIYDPQPPLIRPDDGDRCPKCDGLIINGVCNRCDLDLRKR